MSLVAPCKRALDYCLISTYLPQKVGIYCYLPDYRSRESAITVWRTPAEDCLPVGQMLSHSPPTRWQRRCRTIMLHLFSKVSQLLSFRLQYQPILVIMFHCSPSECY